MTFLHLFSIFTKKYKSQHAIIFFTLIFSLSTKVKNKIDFNTYRNEVIDFKLKKFNKYCYLYFVKNKPLAHITKHSCVCGIDFVIKKKVLAPRDNTELMIKNFLTFNKDLKNKNVYDLCCGSGIIGLCIKKYLSKLNVICVEKYSRPYKNAKINKKKLKLDVQIIKSDVFKYLKKINEVDLIISNPPYINKNNFKNWKNLHWEAKSALFAKDNGLYFYNFYFAWLNNHHFEQCWLEFGYDLKKKLIKKIKKFKNLKAIFQDNYMVIFKKE